MMGGYLKKKKITGITSILFSFYKQMDKMVSLQISPLLPDKGRHPPSEQDLNPGSRVLGLNQNKETRKWPAVITKL